MQELKMNYILLKEFTARCIFLRVKIVNGRKFSGPVSGTAALIDIFRSTSSIPLILARGATEVIPTRTVKEARNLKKKIPGSLLVGERYGFRVPRFDIGNSPHEILSADLKDKTVIFTSTNGTLVLQKIKMASFVYTASFVNHSASLQALRKTNEDISLFMSGRPDGVAVEDQIYADFLKDEIEGGRPDPNEVLEKVRNCNGAKRLRMMGFSDDIDACLNMDSVKFPTRYKDGRITGEK